MTMRVTQGMTSRSILQDLDNSRSRLGTIQREISSTKRISKPSDDPFGTGRTLQLSGELEGGLVVLVHARDDDHELHVRVRGQVLGGAVRARLSG